MLCGRPACAGFPALWCQKDTTWLSFGKPEQKMDLRAVPTTSAHYHDAYILADRRVGKDGQGQPRRPLSAMRRLRPSFCSPHR